MWLLLDSDLFTSKFRRNIPKTKKVVKKLNFNFLNFTLTKMTLQDEATITFSKTYSLKTKPRTPMLHWIESLQNEIFYYVAKFHQNIQKYKKWKKKLNFIFLNFTLTKISKTYNLKTKHHCSMDGFKNCNFPKKWHFGNVNVNVKFKKIKTQFSNFLCFWNISTKFWRK